MSEVEMRLGDAIIYGGAPHPQRGCGIVFNKTNWWDGVDGTGKTIQNEFSDGGWITPDYDASRTIVIEGHIWADTESDLRAGISWFKTQIPSPGVGVLSVTEREFVSHALVRRDGKPTFPWDGGTVANFSIQLIAPDPRKFGGDGSAGYGFSESVLLPVTSGGLVAPFTVPFSIDATVVTGSVTVTTTGDARPPVLVRVDGPVVQPTIRDEETGARMLFDLSLDAGQWLEVDLDRRTIKINGLVSRRSSLRGPWIDPRPGMTLTFGAAVYNPTASMTVSWSDASY